MFTRHVLKCFFEPHLIETSKTCKTLTTGIIGIIGVSTAIYTVVKETTDSRTYSFDEMIDQEISRNNHSRYSKDLFDSILNNNIKNASPMIVSKHCLQGERQTMEDVPLIELNGSFAAIFDGHGGHKVSRYLGQNMFKRFFEHLIDLTINSKMTEKQQEEKQENYPSTNKTLNKTNKTVNFNFSILKWMEESLFNCIDDLENEVMSVKRWRYQGSTLICCLIVSDEKPNINKNNHENNHENEKDNNNEHVQRSENKKTNKKKNQDMKMYEINKLTIHKKQEKEQEEKEEAGKKEEEINHNKNRNIEHRHHRRYVLTANIGDSRAVMGRQGTAIDLSHDHKPNDDREYKRVCELGGVVRWHGLYNEDGTILQDSGV